MRIRKNWVPFALLVGGSLLLGGFIHADDYWVNRSTNATNTSSGYTIPNSRPGDMLGSIIINKHGNAETFTIWDASAALTTNKTNIVATIDLSSTTLGGPFIYNLRLSSGVMFSKSGNASDVTVTYKVFRAN